MSLGKTKKYILIGAFPAGNAFHVQQPMESSIDEKPTGLDVEKGSASSLPDVDALKKVGYDLGKGSEVALT